MTFSPYGDSGSWVLAIPRAFRWKGRQTMEEKSQLLYKNQG